MSEIDNLQFLVNTAAVLTLVTTGAALLLGILSFVWNNQLNKLKDKKAKDELEAAHTQIRSLKDQHFDTETRVIKMESEKRPRTLISGTKKRFQQLMGDCTGAKIHVDVAMGDGEAFTLADQIQKALIELGASADGSVAQAIGAVFQPGIEIITFDRNDSFANRLLYALNSVGLVTKGSYRAGRSSIKKEVEILVGPKS